MWVRVASFENVDFDKMEQRDPPSEMPGGMLGAQVLADRSTGRSLFLAFFDTKDSIDAAAEHFEAMGDEIPEEERGRRTSVEAYEVVMNTWEQ